MTTLPLRCRCGHVRGAAVGLSPERGNHLVCYCDDCQAYARFLEREDVLDAHGGTEIFQMTPAQLRITDGAEQIRCLRLSEKGLMRWFAGCCRTPIANTLASARVPFVGLVLCFVDEAAGDRDRTRALGPRIAGVQGRFARDGLPTGAHPSAPLGLVLRSVRLLVRAWLRRQHRPSPFFEPVGSSPIVAPQVLTPAQRAELHPSA